MIEQSFSLIPFPAPDIPAISLTGRFSFHDSILTVDYVLAGDVEKVSLPPVSLYPGRKDELWKATCFEFFLAIKDRAGYWEFNMSPTGYWNVYRMDAYRRIGFREETAIAQLPYEIKHESDKLSLEISIDISVIIPSEQDLQMAVTAIIQTKDGQETYWALAHPAPHVDFHLRESFILSLARQTHLA